MLKAIKECMKNWLISHERLYWYIVVGLAVFGFGLVTAMGMAKLEKAEAAEEKTFVVSCGSSNAEISNEGYEYYFILYDCVAIDGTENYTCVFFSNEQLKIKFNGAKTRVTVLSHLGDVECLVYVITQNPSDLSVDVISRTHTVSDNSGYGESWSGSYHSNYAFADLPANPYEPPKEYSSSAPYVKFENVTVVNRLMDKDYLASVFTDTYEVYTSGSSWMYSGKLENYDSSQEATYKLEVDFVVELPLDSYILSQYSNKGIQFGNEINFIKCSPDFIQQWYLDSKASVREFSFKYVFDISPDNKGHFTYSLGFDEIETLILYFDEGARKQWQSYDKQWRTALMSYLHVDTVSSVVKVETDSSNVYGRGVINIFERGLYDLAVEIAPEVDFTTMTEEEIDALIKDAIDKAYDDYYSELENRVDDLQNQINDIYSVNDAFGNLEGSGLWTGFQNLSEGLASLSPAIASLSVLAGSVLAFLPSSILTIMSFTFFALCVIAIIKALRG